VKGGHDDDVEFRVHTTEEGSAERRVFVCSPLIECILEKDTPVRLGHQMNGFLFISEQVTTGIKFVGGGDS